MCAERNFKAIPQRTMFTDDLLSISYPGPAGSVKSFQAGLSWLSANLGKVKVARSALQLVYRPVLPNSRLNQKKAIDLKIKETYSHNSQ